MVEIVNFIRTNAKTHRQFKNFIMELQEVEENNELSSDVTIWSIVRWLSVSYVLDRFVELLPTIKLFIKEKGKIYPDLENEI